MTAFLQRLSSEELVLPLLHVLPMTTGYDCSAAAALSCFHVFALQTKGAFDLRWCRGSISETIFAPWAATLGYVIIRNGARVSAMERKGESGEFVLSLDNQEETETYDAVVMAVGGTAMKRLANSCPPIKAMPQSAVWEKSLRGVTSVAVRLFIKPSMFEGSSESGTMLPASIYDAMKDSPVVACGPNILPILKETGFCIYDLQRLQDNFANRKDFAVLEVNFFRADDIVDMIDDDIRDIAIRSICAALRISGQPLTPTDVLEASVLRARNAVSHFCVGSAASSLPVRSKEKGLYFCGDWIDRKGHSSWSTEKAVVTGRQAATALSKDFGLDDSHIRIIPIPPDTSILAAL